MSALIRITGALPCAVQTVTVPRGGQSRFAHAHVYKRVTLTVIVFPAHKGITVDIVRIGGLALLAGGDHSASGISLDMALRWKLPTTADITPALPMQFILTNHSDKDVVVNGIVVWCVKSRFE